jgi:hypothetical protein
MRVSLLLVGAALTALFSLAAHAETLHGTSGSYVVVMEADPTLPEHTIYRPADLNAVPGKLPMIAFGNGGCVNIGTAFQILLGELASHGYIVTAPGLIPTPQPASAPPQPRGPMTQSKPGQMKTAIDWAEREAHRPGSFYESRLDTSRIAVAGQSCGGLEAIAAGGDSRVDTVLVLNSGIIRGGIPNPDGTIRQPAGYLPASEADLARLHTPVAYLIGGQTDQAWKGAEGDFKDIDNVPVFKANIDVGHGGTWREPHGGDMGAAAIAWLDWQLKDDQQAGAMFIGADCTLCKDSKWSVEKKNMQ